MVIVYILLLGVLQCSTNKYTVWNQGVNYVDGTRYILRSNVQPDAYCAVMYKNVTAKHIFSVWNYYSRENTQKPPFLPVPVLFWILSFVVNTIIYRSVILMF
jgi:hypothetical protein